MQKNVKFYGPASQTPYDLRKGDFDLVMAWDGINLAMEMYSGLGWTKAKLIGDIYWDKVREISLEEILSTKWGPKVVEYLRNKEGLPV